MYSHWPIIAGKAIRAYIFETSQGIERIGVRITTLSHATLYLRNLAEDFIRPHDFVQHTSEVMTNCLPFTIRMQVAEMSCKIKEKFAGSLSHQQGKTQTGIAHEHI